MLKRGRKTIKKKEAGKAKERAESCKAMAHELPNAAAFSTAPHVVVTPTKKLFLLLFHNCKFATATNRNVNTCVFQWF